MNKRQWILSESEQVEMGFAPVAVPADESLVASSLVKPNPADWKKPEQFHKLTMEQQELFELDPDQHDFREQYLAKLPRQLRTFFAKQYKKRLTAYGSSYASGWFRQKMDEMLPRVKLVMGQYADVLALFKPTFDDLSWLDSIQMPESKADYWNAIPPNESDTEKAERLARKVARYQVVMPSILQRLENSKRLFSRENLQPLCYQRPDQLQRLADSLAFMMSEVQQRYADLHIHQATDSVSARKILLEMYLEQAEICEGYQITAPNAEKARKGRISDQELETGLLKLICPKYWLRKLVRCAERMKEHLAIAVGMVHAANGGYVSNERLSAYQQQKKANYEFIKNCIITNLLDESEQLELLDTWLKSSSNPCKRRIELMTRMRGFEDWAEENGDEGIFITLTAPSQFHAMKFEGGINPKWNGSAPHHTQKHLCGTWAKIRAELNRQQIKVYGFRVAEPHADATPHWHLLLYTRPEHIRPLKRIIWRYALELDGDEAGARKHRCTFKKIDPAKGSATGYLMKYVAKNIDGVGMDGLTDFETDKAVKLSAERVQAWASLWGIRQFQQIGGAGVGVWRELRKLGDHEQEDEIIDTLRAIADCGDWAAYTDYQGGALVLRKDLKARLHYALYGETLYKEPRKKVNGVANQQNGNITITRLKQWTISRKPTDWEQRKASKFSEIQPLAQGDEAILGELARPWTCVSNCTRTENEQVNLSIRERIKNELIIMRGRVTDYQIDDLLNGKPLKIYSNEQASIYVEYKCGQLVEIKKYLN